MIEEADPCPHCNKWMVWNEGIRDYRHLNPLEARECFLGQHERGTVGPVS